MEYNTEQAARALQIVEGLMPYVRPHPLYRELADLLRDQTRWHEAHDLFSRIREAITLPSETRGKNDLDSLFVYVAENAAKTAYNCSGQPAPFDDDSFEWLLLCEQELRVAIRRRKAASFFKRLFRS